MQAAGGASHSQNTYLASQYRRLVGRRGKKRALIAVGHSLLVIFYPMLKNGTTYADGGDFFDRLEPERLTRYYVKRLESLGHLTGIFRAGTRRVHGLPPGCTGCSKILE